MTSPVLPATAMQSSTYTVKIPASVALPQNHPYSSIGAGGAGYVTVGANTAAVNTTSWLTANTVMGGLSNAQFAKPAPTNIFTLSKSANQEIVRLNLDGSVSWGNGIDIDAAAEAFGEALQMGAELKAGISKAIKLRMRDSVFEDLINIAREKGSLTADDLTYLLEASKIVEKLKGGN